MIELLDDFYERRKKPTTHSQCELGRICDVPISYLSDGAKIPLLKAQYNRHGMAQTYNISKVRPQNSRREEKLPIYEIGQRSDEIAVVHRHKWRPAIVVSSPCDDWQDGARRQHDECFVLAPMYSFGAKGRKLAYSQAFIERVKSYAYNHLFYMPNDAKCNIRESFVRFDRLQVVHERWIVPRSVILHQEFLGPLQSWLWSYLGGDLMVLDDVLADYRDQMLPVQET